MNSADTNADRYKRSERQMDKHSSIGSHQLLKKKKKTSGKITMKQ